VVTWSDGEDLRQRPKASVMVLGKDLHGLNASGLT
jgi:hypothetical protein